MKKFQQKNKYSRGRNPDKNGSQKEIVTQFLFDNSTISNRNYINIAKIRNLEGEQTENPIEIVDTFTKQFYDMLNNFGSSNESSQDEMLKHIPKLISKEDNKFLNEPFTLIEVKTTLFSMNPDNARVQMDSKPSSFNNVGIFQEWICGKPEKLHVMVDLF